MRHDKPTLRARLRTCCARYCGLATFGGVAANVRARSTEGTTAKARANPVTWGLSISTVSTAGLPGCGVLVCLDDLVLPLEPFLAAVPLNCLNSYRPNPSPSPINRPTCSALKCVCPVLNKSLGKRIAKELMPAFTAACASFAPASNHVPASSFAASPKPTTHTRSQPWSG